MDLLVDVEKAIRANFKLKNMEMTHSGNGLD
jgi:hypothetical protein